MPWHHPSRFKRQNSLALLKTDGATSTDAFPPQQVERHLQAFSPQPGSCLLPLTRTRHAGASSRPAAWQGWLTRLGGAGGLLQPRGCISDGAVAKYHLKFLYTRIHSKARWAMNIPGCLRSSALALAAAIVAVALLGLHAPTPAHAQVASDTWRFTRAELKEVPTNGMVTSTLSQANPRGGRVSVRIKGANAGGLPGGVMCEGGKGELTIDFGWTVKSGDSDSIATLSAGETFSVEFSARFPPSRRAQSPSNFTPPGSMLRRVGGRSARISAAPFFLI